MAERYNFKYLPLVGKLPGKSMVEQTETAINELASVVYDNVGHVGNLAEEVQTANTNASSALDKATEALETSSRVYIKQFAAVDVNDYYDSELYYIDNDGSTNIPARDRGFLEVKTNDDKTACEQVFIADSTGTPYYRHGVITEQTLGEKTTYVVTWSSWYGEQQADWNVTDTTSKAFIKNKPDVVTYKRFPYQQTAEWESNCVQSIAEGMATDHPDAYNYGTQVTLGVIGNGASARIYFPHNGGMYLKNFWGNYNSSGWLTMLSDKNFALYALPKNGIAVKATADAAGNNIQTTYAKKSDLANYLPLSGGTLTGAINTANKTWNKLGDDASFGDYNIGGKMCVKSQTGRNTGIAFFNQSDTNVGQVEVNNAFDFNKPVKENGGFLVPTGVVQAFAGSTIPTGWLLCDGSAVSRTTYANLYACIGTTYGTGNGSTTFNLPNLVDKFVEGSATAGTVKSAGLPNIKESPTLHVHWNDYAGQYTVEPESGSKLFHKGPTTAKSSYPNVASSTAGNYGGDMSLGIDASKLNPIYGNSTTVQPPALTMRYIIKY